MEILIKLQRKKSVGKFLQGWNNLLQRSEEEHAEAEFAILRCIQREEFDREWAALSKNETGARSSTHNFWRITWWQETENTKHPIVLPASHALTRLLS